VCKALHTDLGGSSGTSCAGQVIAWVKTLSGLLIIVVQTVPALDIDQLHTLLSFVDGGGTTVSEAGPFLKAHRLVYHSYQGLRAYIGPVSRVLKKKKKKKKKRKKKRKKRKEEKEEEATTVEKETRGGFGARGTLCREEGCFVLRREHTRVVPTSRPVCRCSIQPFRETVLYRQPAGPNPLNHQNNFSAPALRHRSLNSLFQVASYLPSSAALHPNAEIIS